MARTRFGIRETLIVLAALALLGFGFISFLYRVEATVPMLGVQWVQSGEGPLALQVDPEAAAWHAGIIEVGVSHPRGAQGVEFTQEAKVLAVQLGEEIAVGLVAAKDAARE